MAELTGGRRHPDAPGAAGATTQNNTSERRKKTVPTRTENVEADAERTRDPAEAARPGPAGAYSEGAAWL